MSLPLAFGTELETVPAQVPYLSIPEPALQKARALPWPDRGLARRRGLGWKYKTSEESEPLHLRFHPFSAPLQRSKAYTFSRCK